jgi:hypothetical protein
LNHESKVSISSSDEGIAKEDEVKTRRQCQDHECKGDDHQEQSELSVPIDVLARSDVRRIRLELTSTRTNSDKDDVSIANEHDRKGTQIVKNEMNTLPLWINVTRIGACGITIDFPRWLAIAVEEQNMTIQGNTKETETENIVFRIANFPIRLFPRRKKQTQSPISNKRETSRSVKRNGLVVLALPRLTADKHQLDNCSATKVMKEITRQ